MEEIPQIRVELRTRSLGTKVALFVRCLNVYRLDVTDRSGCMCLGQLRRTKVGWTGAEAGGGKAHLDSSFAHAFKGVSTCFGGRTFVDEIPEDGCGCQDGVIHLLEGLSMVSEGPHKRDDHHTS